MDRYEGRSVTTYAAADDRDDSAGPGAPEPGRPGWLADSGRRSIVMRASATLAACLALILVCGSLFAYVKYREVWDKIARVDVSRDVNSTERPPVDPHAINILLIGSDSRAGVNGKIGGHVGIGGQRSDTVMVMHVSPGAHRATVLSFPRDSVVPILACPAEGGATGQTADPGQMEQINSTFAYGGPGCLWHTIEATSHIRIDDFIEMTFIGFEKIIDDLGGVNVCLPEPVDVPASGLDLSAGRHHIYGAQALAFWRTREELGEGSDIQRIERDQFLMASLLQGIEKSGLLTSTTKMAGVIGDVASHMTTNIVSPATMLHIADNLRGLTSKSVQFIEIPVVTYPGNDQWVEWSTAAPQLFAAIAHDTKLPKKPKAKRPGAALAAVKPANIKVKILNGSGEQGLAAEGAADLTNRGFDVVGSGNASNFAYTDSVVEYASAAELAAARAVQAELTDVEILKVPSVPPKTIDLILGSSFTELKTPTSSGSPASLTQTFGGITGNVSLCQDSSAFSGPDGS